MNSQTDAYNAKISALLKSSEPNEATRLLRAGDRMQDRAGTAGFRSATANNRASTILAEKADDEDAIRRNEYGYVPHAQRTMAPVRTARKAADDLPPGWERAMKMEVTDNAAKASPVAAYDRLIRWL